MSKRNTPKRAYSKMSKDELREATKEFDAERVEPQAAEAPADVKARHDQARAAAAKLLEKRGRGRPVVGEGSTVVPISIERGLLKQADEFAAANGLKRSELVSNLLRQAMAKWPAKVQDDVQGRVGYPAAKGKGKRTA